MCSVPCCGALRSSFYMRCNDHVSLLLAVSAIVAHVSCNAVATAESHNREKRQNYRDYGGPPGQGQQFRPGEGPRDRNYDRVDPGNGAHARPQAPRGSSHALPLSLSTSTSSTNDIHNGNSNLRPAGTQNSGIRVGITLPGLGTGIGIGGSGGDAPRNPSSVSGGLGGVSSLGGIGSTTQGASLFGINPVQDTTAPLSFGGNNGANSANAPAQNMGLLNLGGVQQNPALINVGGQQSSPSAVNYPTHSANYDTTGHRGGPQAPNWNSPQQFPPQRIPPGQQGRPGHNPPGFPGAGGPPQGPGRPGERPGERPPSGRPGGQPNQRPGDGTEWNENRRPGGEEEVFEAGRPVHGQGQGQGQSNSGGGGHQGNQGNQGNHGNQGNRGNQGNNGNQGNQGGSNKACRGNQYTCKNRECVGRNARCNGVDDCQDRSDELNCPGTQNHAGVQDPSNDYSTTNAPFGGLTTASPTSGCILPHKPTGGSFERGGCGSQCSIEPGTRVPIGGYLTYRCNEGYTLKGNNVSFCHDGSWYLPPTCSKTCSALKSNSVDIECKYRGEIVSCETAVVPGTKATLACKHSYKIPLANDPAYRELTCLDEGVWDRTLFRCLPDCGTAVAHGNTLIVNGFTAKLGVFPWHVGIYQRNSAGKYQQICAGTLVSSDLVISAAHCFYDDTVNEVSDASHYAVAAGKHYRSWVMPEKYAQTSMVKKIDVATRYFGASGNFAEDISLVRLESPFTLTTLVRPICMDWDNTYEREQLQSGQSGKAVGWGKTAEGEPSSELQEINLPYIPYQECVSAVPEEFKGYVTADKFCAGYLNGSSLCEGDSGGGLCFQLNGLWYLRGIVSVSPVSENTCDNNYYTAFTNVGRFREWIRAAYVAEVSNSD